MVGNMITAHTTEHANAQVEALQELLQGLPPEERGIQGILAAAKTVGAATLSLDGCAEANGGQYSLVGYKPETTDVAEPVLGRSAALFVRYAGGLSGLSCQSILGKEEGPQSTWYLGVPVSKAAKEADRNLLRFAVSTPDGPRVHSADTAGGVAYAAALRPAARMLLHLLAPTELKSL